MTAQSTVAITATLILSHLIAAITAFLMAPVGVMGALISGAAAGLLITLPLQRTLLGVAAAVDGLSRTQPTDPLPGSGHFLLAGLAQRTNLLLEQGRGLRTQLRETAAQQERNRLARDLHDSIKQQLFSIRMSAAAVEARWEHDQPGARQALTDVRQRAGEALAEMNAMLRQLSPAPLERIGLVEALREQAEALGYRTGAQVDTVIGTLPPEERLPAGTPETLFRVAQEAFSNVARHARAASVSLTLHTADALVLTIRDDGSGFDPKTAAGMGLDNIRQRVAALGGRFTLTTGPDEGTRLDVHIPLLEDDTMTDQINHTLNKTVATGALGGVIVAGLAALAVAALDDPMLAAAALLIAPGIGYAAARIANGGTRPQRVVLGALAGLLAALLGFALVGGAIATEVAISPLLRDLLSERPVTLEIVTAQAVLRVVWVLTPAYWLTVVAGSALGALGGLLAPAHGEPLPLADLLRPAVYSGVWLSGFNLMITVAILRALPGQLRAALAGVDALYPIAGMYWLPVGSAVLLFVGFLGAGVALTVTHPDPARQTMAWRGLASAAVALVLTSAAYAVISETASTMLVIAALIIVAVIVMRPIKPQGGPVNVWPMLVNSVGAAVAVAFAVGFSVMTLVGLGLVLGVVPAIPVMAGEATMNATDLLAGVYRGGVVSVLWGVGYAVIVTVPIGLTMAAVEWVRSRAAARQEPEVAA